jgi:parvulin-like peptidyl-prolyl isomerase
LPETDESGDAGSRNLPAGAPTSVSFGVVLFTYQGVQFAPPGARSKEEALEKAKAVVEEATKDFAEAVKKGDRGSTADAGRIPRGVLEPELELVLFTLEKGKVHAEPIDTPRGYWVVRRVQ